YIHTSLYNSAAGRRVRGARARPTLLSDAPHNRRGASVRRLIPTGESMKKKLILAAALLAAAASAPLFAADAAPATPATPATAATATPVAPAPTADKPAKKKHKHKAKKTEEAAPA